MHLEGVVPWGRSFEEYLDIFNLSDEELGLSILGCGDGPASFNAELTSRGGRIISVDPVYRFTREQLERRISETFDEIIPQVEKNSEMYVWKSVASVEELCNLRTDAMKRFGSDFDAGKRAGRYRDESLPSLSFPDKHFDLALCSHCLFLYSEQFGLEQHLASVRELSRVARQTRIYPLIALDGKLSPHLSEVRSTLHDLGARTSLVDVNYQFQKGATQMLIVESL